MPSMVIQVVGPSDSALLVEQVAWSRPVLHLAVRSDVDRIMPAIIAELDRRYPLS